MKIIKDNDFEVLGTNLPAKDTSQKYAYQQMQDNWDQASRKSAGKGWKVFGIVVITIILTLMAVGLYCLLTSDKAKEAQAVQEAEITATPAESNVVKFLSPVTDTINDVPLTIISVENAKAKVTFDLPAEKDDDVLFATSAADVRADNDEIVGEFIHNKQQLSNGIKKTGFCYIASDGAVSLGMGEADDVKQKAVADGGTFFRQYALVINGEIQPCQLKGKSKRRAIAIQDGQTKIVMSNNQESVYDFAQALADYGFSYAIYIPGGNGFIMCRTADSLTYYNCELMVDVKNATYLVFTR